MNVNNVVLDKIKKYSDYIDEFRSQTNIQGIWLFTSTLGCWGVDIPWVKLAACGLLLMMFVFLVHDSIRDEKRTFNQVYNAIKKEILENLSDDTQKARLYDLDSVEKKRKSIKHILKTTPIFLICYGFYFFTLMFFIFKYLEFIGLLHVYLK